MRHDDVELGAVLSLRHRHDVTKQVDFGDDANHLASLVFATCRQRACDADFAATGVARSMRTGTGDALSTASATEPTRSRAIPERP